MCHMSLPHRVGEATVVALQTPALITASPAIPGCPSDQSTPDPTAFEQLSAGGDPYGCLGIAVPPRGPENVYHSRPRLRIAIKDCYMLQGLKNSLCNKGYYEYSDIARYTAEAVQLLVD